MPTTTIYGTEEGIFSVESGMISERFLAYAGQTVFNIATFSYVQDTSSVWVFKNREKLVIGTDYIEASPTSIALLTPAALDDIIEIVGMPIQAVTVIDNTIYHTFPFYLANGSMDNIPLNSSGELPFNKADGTSSNIPIV